MSALIQFDRIGKTYANGTRALDDVTFTLHAGRIHAICGENGAGKSTLMKILFGLEQPSAGMLRLRGAELALDSPRTAAALGIGMVHQHFSLIPALTVADNLALGQEPLRRGGLLLDRRAAAERVRALARRYRLPVEPDAIVATLSVAMQQKVEILKALSHEIELLILDEPTAVLTPQETAELFARLRELNRAGLTIVFISHKLREVRALADRVIVLRGGRVSSDTALSDVSDADITRLAMGQAVAAPARAGPAHARGPAVVTLDRVSRRDGPVAQRIADLSLTLHAGEIVGVAGIDGSGQAGLVGALMGGLRLESGRVLLAQGDGQSDSGQAGPVNALAAALRPPSDRKRREPADQQGGNGQAGSMDRQTDDVPPQPGTAQRKHGYGPDCSVHVGMMGALADSRRPRPDSAPPARHTAQRDISGVDTGARRRLGFGHLPADRLRDGSAPALSLIDNAMAGAQRLLRFSKGPWLRRAAWQQASAAMVADYDVRCASTGQPLSALSGGNAQKLIAARELGARPRVLVAEEPTRGIDVRAAAFLHTRLLDLAAGGGAVLLLSSDLDELLALSDRIVVMHGGRIVAEFARAPQLTPERLGAAMLGLEAAA